MNNNWSKLKRKHFKELQSYLVTAIELVKETSKIIMPIPPQNK